LSLVSAEDRQRLAAILGDRNRPRNHVAWARIVQLLADRLDVAAVAAKLAAIDGYLDEHNADPEPFVSTAAPASIIAKLDHVNASVH
jgi:hypothetical protein